MTRFLTGLGIGLGIGALIAPRSGEESREWLRSRGQSLWNDAREKVGALVPQGSSSSFIEALNSVGRDRLMSIYGVGPLTADKIIAARPFDSEESFLAQRLVPESTFESLHSELLKRTA
jgi:hypothetical protein